MSFIIYSRFLCLTMWRIHNSLFDRVQVHCVLSIFCLFIRSVHRKCSLVGNGLLAVWASSSTLKSIQMFACAQRSSLESNNRVHAELFVDFVHLPLSPSLSPTLVRLSITIFPYSKLHREMIVSFPLLLSAKSSKMKRANSVEGNTRRIHNHIFGCVCMILFRSILCG